MSWTLCIDFGTAFSKAAVAPSDSWSRFDPGLIRPLMLGGENQGANTFLLPSAVFVDDARILFGPAAIARAAALADKKRAALKSFKTLLSVSDLDRALNTGLPASIDPHRQFSMGDLITLYLAYLNASIDRAVAADAVLERFAALDRRYAAPAWRGGDATGLHGVIMGVFGQAEAARDLLGNEVLGAEGIAIEKAKDAVAKARASDRVAEMGLIFEATAAAAYTSVGLDIDAPALIIADMGAGTTDIAVLARAGARIEELPEARLTLKQAGDYIDSVIANLILDANPRVKKLPEQTALWSAAIRGMRGFKETLFAEGRASMRHDGKVTTVTVRALENHKDFRVFARAVGDAYDAALEAASKYAVMHGRREIQSVAVGGGAHAPFIQDLIRRKPKRNGKVQVIPRPPTPDWAHAAEFQGNLAPVFPQLAIAIGGAIAPLDMLAAGATPAAAVRSDSRVAPG